MVLDRAQPSLCRGQLNLHLSQGRAGHGVLSGGAQCPPVGGGRRRNCGIRRRGHVRSEGREFAASLVGMTCPHRVAPGDRNGSPAGDVSRGQANRRAPPQRGRPGCSNVRRDGRRSPRPRPFAPPSERAVSARGVALAASGAAAPPLASRCRSAPRATTDRPGPEGHAQPLGTSASGAETGSPGAPRAVPLAPRCRRPRWSPR